MLADLSLRLAPDGKPRNLILYSGVTLREWIDTGMSEDPYEFCTTVTASSGPDGAVLHWRVNLRASVWTSVHGSVSCGRIPPALPPMVEVTELPRTFEKPA